MPTLIAHRGNLEGPDPERENRPEYVRQALSLGYEAEVDVWRTVGRWWLGHDEPQYAIDFDFLRCERLWCHAKNLAALEGMLFDSRVHCFWHERDMYTLTSRGIIWAYPGGILVPGAIAVCPELAQDPYTPPELGGAGGICTDHVLRYSALFAP